MIYLDYNATTPLLKEIVYKMRKVYIDNFGNPVSLHSAGQMSAKEVLMARNTIAKFFCAESDGVIFTSSGAEANNLILWGSFLYHKINNTGKNHIIVSSVEHPSILEPINILQKLGLEVDFIKCDRFCNIKVDDIKNKIRPQTFLISIMHSNNEIGTLQNIKKINEIKTANSAGDNDIMIHSDIAQSIGKVAIDFKALNIDAITVSAHKFFGPKGIGAIIFYKKPELLPVISGGIQEGGLRAGTHNVSGIIGFKLAVEYITKNIERIEKALKRRFDFLYNALGTIKGVVINTPYENTINNTINISIPSYTKDELLVKLDSMGICVSTGTACLSGTPRVSHVLEAMGVDEKIAKSAIRISFSHFTKRRELNTFINTVKSLVK
jgi:cysteine desulfurase